MAETLIEHLRSQRTLLVVDNCEQLVDDCAALAHEILRHCPDVTLLATSREALGVEGEVVYQIPPLEVPERQQNLDLVRLLKCESVDLFMDRARLVAPHFALDSETAGPVAELCRQLDGIPLAIELAAARIASMTPGQVLDRLSDRFSLLSAGPRTAPERHRTLRATLDWSHELLSETEATLFRHLAIFTGSFSLEAAEAVCAVGDVEVTSIPTHLGALTTKSLVMVKPGVEQTIRFRMLDTVHDFSLQKLAESGESLELAPRHCEFFLKFAEEAGPNLRGDRAAAWRTKLAEDLDNLRAALRWSAEHDHQANARLNVALVDVWHFHGLVQEGESWMVEALHSYDARDETRADLLRVGGQIAFWRADLSSTSSRCSESVDIYRELGRGKRFAVALAQVGQVAEWSGALESAHELYDEALVLARETHDDRGLETTLRFMGRLALVEGKHADVLEYLSQSISVDERTGDQRAKHWSLGYLALNAICIGDLDGARTHLEESLEIALSLDLSIGVASTLIYWATLEAALGRPIRAMRLAGAAHSIARSAGAAPMRLTKGVVDPWLEKSRRELGAEQSQACTDEGRLMSQERAVEYALEG